jgi:cytoskeletal protein CcmA (bactofilin family)
MSSIFGTQRPQDSMGSVNVSGKPPATVIAKGVKVEGEFKSQGDVLIEGDVHGTLATTGTLTVGPEAKIKAEIAAGDAVVSGSIDGNVKIEKRLELKATAKIVGDVQAEVVSIEAGAQIQGKMAIGMKPAHADAPFSAPAKAERKAAASAA